MTEMLFKTLHDNLFMILFSIEVHSTPYFFTYAGLLKGLSRTFEYKTVQFLVIYYFSV